jgi:hypothetical protein
MTDRRAGGSQRNRRRIEARPPTSLVGLPPSESFPPPAGSSTKRFLLSLKCPYASPSRHPTPSAECPVCRILGAVSTGGSWPLVAQCTRTRVHHRTAGTNGDCSRNPMATISAVPTITAVFPTTLVTAVPARLGTDSRIEFTLASQLENSFRRALD